MCIRDRGHIEKEKIVSAISDRKVFPCYFGSALKMQGVDELLDGIEQYAQMPSYSCLLYTSYKILDLEVNEDRTAYSYILNTEWSEFFTAGAGKDYAETKTVGTQTYVTWKNDKKSADDLETFGRLAASYAKGKSAEDTITPDSDDDIVFSGLEPGYYLITSTNGNQEMCIRDRRSSGVQHDKNRRWIHYGSGREWRQSDEMRWRPHGSERV